IHHAVTLAVVDEDTPAIFLLLTELERRVGDDKDAKIANIRKRLREHEARTDGEVTEKLPTARGYANTGDGRQGNTQTGTGQPNTGGGGRSGNSFTSVAVGLLIGVLACGALFFLALQLPDDDDQTPTPDEPTSVVIEATEPSGDAVTEVAPSEEPTADAEPTPFGASGRLLFTSDTNSDGNGDLYLLDVPSGEVTPLSIGPEDIAVAVWSPDGTQIAYETVIDGNWNIYVMDADGTNPQRLTTSSADDFRPAWSPDGNHIVFHTRRHNNREIYMINLNTFKTTRLTNTDAENYDPSFSPDGKRIVFESDRGGDREIYVMNFNGRNVTQLTDEPDGSSRDPVFSPDGERIAYVYREDGFGYIYTMSTEGDNWMQITEADADAWSPAWSPDGQWLAFESNLDGLLDIYYVPVDGSLAPRKLTSNNINDEFPDWVSIP
ncbi:MAG: DPP IV N-terminal domain-containing protein, partial [Chloroflexota bacterium]